MSVKKILVYAFIGTFIAIGYVNQQVQIVKLSYDLREKENRLTEAVDLNRVLLYNNSSLKSPKYLLAKCKANSINLTLPETTSVARVRFVKNKNKLIARKSRHRWLAGLMDVFVPKAQAALDRKN